MAGRSGSGWGKAGVLLLGVVALVVVGTSVLVGTQLLSSTGGAQAQKRAVEPTGAKQDPPKAVAETTEAEEPEKADSSREDDAQKDEAKKEEPEEEPKKDEELSDEEQAEVADSFSAPEEVASASASASAEATTEEAPASASAEATTEEAPASASAEATTEEASASASAPADTTMSLSVPSIGLSTTVYESASESSLTAGTGHLGGTGYPWIPGSNTYVAGHRLGYPGTGSDHVFWDLPSVAIGDPVSLTDANGQTYDYAVSEILEVPITDLSVTEPVGSDVVSLQTCIEDYGNYWAEGPNWNVRYVVRAEKV